MHNANVLRNYKFFVTFGTPIGVGSDATSQLGFQTVSGLSQESEVIEYREGTNAAWMAKMPGQVSVGDVTFERGAASDKQYGSALVQWYTQVKNVMENNAITTSGVRRTIFIDVAKEIDVTASAPGGRMRYELGRAWPSSLEIGDLDSGSSEVLIETMTVVAETLTVGEV